ncbi:MAG: N-acetylmuramoyl-L-alanine amidase [Clostridiales bacterium]|nr:N-acetylmuramoyl-L-alanine amidase [Clostridiales bacterium]
MKIGVNEGHTISGVGSGAIGIINESEQTRKVGAVVRRLLSERGHETINCTIDYANTVNESLCKVVDQANREDLDWFIAIHFNAGGGKGVEVYTYEGRQYQDALDVCNNISKLGFNNRGVKAGTGLYVVRKTKAKAMLIEVCFVDTEDANNYLNVGCEAIGKAIVDALCDAINTSIKNSTTTTQVIQNDNWVSRLQKEINLQGFGAIDVDGIAGPKTLGSCPLLKIGAQGNITKLLQEKLGIIADGIFGPNTKKAVELFQKNNVLVVDGIVGINSWRKLLGLE